MMVRIISSWSKSTAQESAIDAVHYLPPVDVLVGEELVKHVFLAGELLTDNAFGGVEAVLMAKTGTRPSDQGPDLP